MSMDLYKYAAMHCLRFPSSKGFLTAEQLFGLPLKSKTGAADLDTVARAVNAALKEVSEESFVEQVKTDPRKEHLEISLELVKDVIRTKQAENAVAVAKASRAAERRKILDALAAKKDQALTTKTVDELEKELAALED